MNMALDCFEMGPDIDVVWRTCMSKCSPSENGAETETYFICPLTKAMGKLKMRRNPAHDSLRPETQVMSLNHKSSLQQFM